MIDVMLRRERLAVAVEAFRTIESNALLLAWRAMRIMAAHARHSISTLLLADALRDRLHLAQGRVALRLVVL